MDKPFDIGVIVKPQGVRGELRVLPVTDDPERFALLNEVLVSIGGKPPVPYALEHARTHGGLVLVKLAGVDDRDAAAALTGGVLKIPAHQALPLGENEYYLRDLIGMRVFDAQDAELGEIADVLRTGANDVYVVHPLAGKDFMIPAVREFILSVSVPERRMVVRLMEGLRE